MNDITVRRFEMCVRVAGFLTGNPMTFRKGSQGPMLVAQFQRMVEEVRGLVVKQASDIGAARHGASKRGVARRELVAALKDIRQCAAGIAVTAPGFADNFRQVRNLNGTELLVCAQQYAENAALRRSDFIRFEMAPTFVDDLNSKIEAFEQGMADHSASRSSRVAAVELIDTRMQDALAILAQLDPIVSNKLAGNADLKAQWQNVRHVERRWVSKKPEAEPATRPVAVKPQPAADPAAAAA